MTNSTFRFSSLATLLLLAAVGCQKSDDPRVYHLSGTAKIDGKPIETGKISFLPNRKEGVTGPMGIASIVNGSYDTKSVGGRPTVGGPHIVQIEDFPVVELNDFEEVVRRKRAKLKKPHSEDLDIPKEKAVVQDFDINTKGE